MSPKQMLFLYGRNARGVFFGGFKLFAGTEYLAPLAWLVHLLLLPLTMTFGAFIKTCIDILSRKEIPSESMIQLDKKIDDLDNEHIEPLITKMSNYHAKSKSSKKLNKTLKELSTNAKDTIHVATAEKKWALQIDQLKSEKYPDPLKVYIKKHIFELELDEKHQEDFNVYIIENTQNCTTQKFDKQKKEIKTYLEAEKNKGKKMQHIIYNHFFPLPVIEKPAEKQPDNFIAVNQSNL